MRRRYLLPLTLGLVAVVALGWPSAASAQRRGATRVVVARGFYPFYSPFYDPWFGPGWGGWGWGGWGWGYPYYAGWRIAPPEASLRLDVRPRDAQVYVDGYFAGEIDQFDGAFQRLRVRPGQHEITVYKEGYRTIRERLYLPANSNRKLTHDLAPRDAGEPDEPPPAPAVRGADEEDDARTAAPPAPPAPPRTRAPLPPPGPERRSSRDGRTGTIVVRVQPGDARIAIDGESWTSGGDNERLVVQLDAGPHRVEVEKEGYRPVTVDVDVRGGETTPVNISLRRD